MTDAEKLDEWVRTYLWLIKTINKRYDSYGLKRYAEKMLCFYVSNDDMKESMVRCGYEVADRSETNWCFNVSQRAINRCVKAILWEEE